MPALLQPLQNTSGAALIFFLNDEIEVIQDSVDKICQTIANTYQYPTWHSYLWDAIFVDVDNSRVVASTDTMIQRYTPLFITSGKRLCLVDDIYDMMMKELPTTVRVCGYYRYTYSEFI